VVVDASLFKKSVPGLPCAGKLAYLFGRVSHGMLEKMHKIGRAKLS
jgi:hypothetical protein